MVQWSFDDINVARGPLPELPFFTKIFQITKTYAILVKINEFAGNELNMTTSIKVKADLQKIKADIISGKIKTGHNKKPRGSKSTRLYRLLLTGH
jgi:hypothetical protein